MEKSLYELLSECTARITVKNTRGTGFFVAPGLVLTCAHVVEDAQKNGAPIEASWNGQGYPAQIEAFRPVSLADVALLHVSISGHPCVLLNSANQPRDRLYTYGFGDHERGGASTTFDSEGWAGENDTWLKFKLGRAYPGMSGSPVLNENTGGVCGIMQVSYDRNSLLGGKALSTREILREFQKLEELNRQFHQQDTRWVERLRPEQRKALGLAASTGTKQPIEIFYSYVEADEKYAKELQKQLILLRRKEWITDWHAGKLLPEEEPSAQILEHLNRATIILLLVSPDYMYSEYHEKEEVKRAMERSESKEAVVIPILVRPTANLQDSPFQKLLVIPRNRKPINKWSDKDEAFMIVAQEIRAVVERMRGENKP